MKITLKVFALIAAVCSAVSFVSCSKSKAQNLKEVRFATNPFVGNAPFYVAFEKGYFAQEGIDFKLQNYEESTSACTALITGNAEIAYTTLDAALITESQTAENKLKVFQIVDESYGADGILAKNEITKLEDLAGKTIGVSIGQTTHYLLLQALNKAGLKDTDVNLLNLNSSDAGVAFMSGSLDAAVTWEPYLSNAVTNGSGKIIFSSVDAPGAIVDVMAVKTSDEDADWVEKFQKAYDKGLSFVNDPATKDEAYRITAKYLDTDAEEVAAMIPTVKLYSSSDSKTGLAADAVGYMAVKNISDFYFGKSIISRQIDPEVVIKK